MDKYLRKFSISKGPGKAGNWIYYLLLFIIISTPIGLYGASWWLTRDLPPLEELRGYHPSLVTKVYSDDQRVIGEFYVERRTIAPLQSIPKDLSSAIIAVEDARFFEHKGIDLLGIIRAFLANLEALKIKQGASTITQQLARSLFLSPERSLKRKMTEVLLARRMEKALSKEEILETYLNQIYFGHGAYGVQSAARTYFGKDVGELTLAESALLAGLPRSPNEYSPINHPERAKQRQEIVLKRMLAEKFIDDERYKKAVSEDILLRQLREKDEIPSYFLEYIRLYLIGVYGDDMVYKGGLNIYTTLNLDMQKLAAKTFKKGLMDVDKRQGFRGPISRKTQEDLTMIKEKEGGIKDVDFREDEITDGIVTKITPAYASVLVNGVSGKIMLDDMRWAAKKLKGRDIRKNFVVSQNPAPQDILKVGDVIKVAPKKLEGKERFFNLEQEPIVEGAFISLDPRNGEIKAMVGGYDFKRSEYNRAVSARRQPGSAFKPIIYATGIDSGLTPSTMIIDSPVIYDDLILQNTWKPENYEQKFYGPITLREALAHSRNVATVKLLERIKVRNVIDFAKKVGISSPLTDDLSLALGSSGIGLLELTSAYSVFANQGLRAEPYAIREIRDKDGNILESHEAELTEVIPKETAYIITNMMEDVIEHGTGSMAKVLKRPLAGKTGTTNEFTDAWFIGYSPNHVAGVWVGFDDMRSLGDREAGAGAALPIWISYMKGALDLLPFESFSVPEDIVFAKVDPENGLLASEGTEKAVTEVFIRGKEPKQVSVKNPSPTQFYRIDEVPQ